MAGTRRQSRARDTINTHKRQRSASQVVSKLPDSAVSANANINEIAESADGGSPSSEGSSQSETPMTGPVAAFCKKCYSKIGEFYNSWHKITSSYYSPTLLGSYRSLLRISDQRKQASESTELAGCIIDLTCCPSCNTYLGFVVVDTSPGRKRFRGRKFFKLQHIELRCETSPNKAITVEPQEAVAPDLVASAESESPSPTRTETVADTMELDTPLSSSHPLWSKPAQPEQREHQHSQPREPRRQSFQSAATSPPVAVSRSPISRSVGSMDIASLTTPSQPSPQPAQVRSVHTIGSSIQHAQPESTINGHNDSHKYPRDPRDVHFDAIERLQTQTSQNTSALAAQARTQIEAAEIVRQIESSLRSEFQGLLQRQDQELRRMSEAVNQLMRDLTECRQTMAGLAHEVHVARTENVARASEGVQPDYQDEALELMARRIGEVAHRTTDLETLRDHVSILGGKVLRLESESASTRQPHTQQSYVVPQPAHSVHVAQAAPVHPNQAPAFQTPVRPTSNPHTVLPHEKSAVSIPPESAQRYEPGAGQNGWATVNAGVKRVYDSNASSPHQGANSAPASPKRPKLGTGDSQDSYPTAQPPLETSHILPSQTQPIVGSQPLSQSGPYAAPHQGSISGTHPAPSQIHPPYGTHDGLSDPAWRSESQRMVDGRPARGRGSRGGRGPGSRGGRVRKSMQGQHHPNGTPEWERDQWTAVPNTQPSPSVYESHSAHPVRSAPRRGGGGSAARIGSLPLDRSNEWTPEIGPRTVYHNQDSPIEVKKTRSKPVRNEDGILVRKDGRPDRRSQSSAANLRKVHARKEEQQREAEAGLTPTGLRHTTSAGLDTPSPNSHTSQEHDVTDSVRKKHHEILGRIFPDGLDTSRKQHDYAHQVFNEDRDHTAHPRSQVPKTAKPTTQVKKESVERSEVAETQAFSNGDVQMSDAGAFTSRHARKETRTRSGGAVYASEQSTIQQEQDSPPGTAHEGSVKIPETQTTDGSATLAAQSVEAV
ncbi:hypothetical protein SVAN01_10227 [Stagonosporopsis vannaccii]|nr:hypothetical protein SVAN01_10227 [Stagonosporopsis vannaccii]